IISPTRPPSSSIRCRTGPSGRSRPSAGIRYKSGKRSLTASPGTKFFQTIPCCTINPGTMAKKRIAVIGLKGLPPFGGAANVGDNIIAQLSKDYDFTIYATASHTHHRGDYKGARQIVFKKF